MFIRTFGYEIILKTMISNRSSFKSMIINKLVHVLEVKVMEKTEVIVAGNTHPGGISATG